MGFFTLRLVVFSVIVHLVSLRSVTSYKRSLSKRSYRSHPFFLSLLPSPPHITGIPKKQIASLLPECRRTQYSCAHSCRPSTSSMCVYLWTCVHMCVSGSNRWVCSNVRGALLPAGGPCTPEAPPVHAWDPCASVWACVHLCVKGSN